MRMSFGTAPVTIDQNDLGRRFPVVGAYFHAASISAAV
jgi:hypothetical protein